MNSIFRGGFVYIVLGALSIGAVCWCICGENEGESAGERPTLVSQDFGNDVNGVEVKRAKPRKSVRRLDTRSETVGEKPNLSLSDGDEAKLTEEMRRIYQELQQALDAEDKQKVFALVHKLQSMKEWPDGIPQSVKMRALDALAWFGGAGMAEAVGFLADGDAEVVNATVEKFEEMLCDFDLGDTGVSEILSQIVKVVHDVDALDSFFMELNNMRDTVKAQTALNIFDSKNPDAISVLEENLDFIFGEADYEVKTREDVERFLKDAEQVYKDDPEKAADDEDFYGPPKN